MRDTRIEGPPPVVESPASTREVRTRPRRNLWRELVPFGYLLIAAPVAILLCFLTPPMQSPDEGRHFLRACQIASGQIVSEIDPKTQQAGGWLPAAASDFVRDKMSPDYFRQEDRYHTIGERLRSLDDAASAQRPLNETKFASFPGATIYSPSLYLPQSLGIALARVFSSKVYIWFYSARLLNAMIAIAVIFAALRLAPAYQLVLLIPAMLPMSLFQISTVSSDAGFIALSILFVALSVRFLERDSLAIRVALTGCLLLLVTGKPVYLPLAFLILAAHKRLGWRRAILFFCTAVAISAAAYIGWSALVRPFVALAGQDFPGRAPATQLRFIAVHPISFAVIVLRTIRYEGLSMIREVIGLFGWLELPLPGWLYGVWIAFFLGIAALIFINRKTTRLSKPLWGALAAASTIGGVFLAGFVLWTPIDYRTIPWIQGRYFLPVLPLLAFFFPPLDELGARSKKALQVLVPAFLLLSTFATMQIVRHYYFAESTFSGRNVHQLSPEAGPQVCPAEVQAMSSGWFSSVAQGRADVPGYFRVLVADEQGTVLAESDPVLTNGLLFATGAKWRVHLWKPNRDGALRYWLVTGKSACTFGPPIKLEPYVIPDA
jgi:uncharacterized membrane protein